MNTFLLNLKLRKQKELRIGLFVLLNQSIKPLFPYLKCILITTSSTIGLTKEEKKIPNCASTLNASQLTWLFDEAQIVDMAYLTDARCSYLSGRVSYSWSWRRQTSR
jgi:hypothetical protein